MNHIDIDYYWYQVHKNHDVQTIRKAYPQIKMQVDEQLQQIQQKQDDLRQFQDHFVIQKKEMVEHNR